jgi:hypothetical protein
MCRRITSIATISLAGLFSLSAWAQVASPGGGGAIGGPNATAPSGAAITHTPGTPGASDTPGALQSSHANGSAPVSLSRADIRALKKQARKASDSSAPVSDTPKSSSAAPPK